MFKKILQLNKFYQFLHDHLSWEDIRLHCIIIIFLKFDGRSIELFLAWITLLLKSRSPMSKFRGSIPYDEIVFSQMKIYNIKIYYEINQCESNSLIKYNRKIEKE